MLERSADSAATPEAVWILLARPENWARWAPHIRGAWGLAGADGVVREGARGAARLLGAVPVPVVITAVEPGRSWTWRVAGVVEMHHRVAPRRAGGSTVTVALDGPVALRAAMTVTYAPLVGILVARLARIAEG